MCLGVTQVGIAAAGRLNQVLSCLNNLHSKQNLFWGREALQVVTTIGEATCPAMVMPCGNFCEAKDRVIVLSFAS